MIYFTENSIVNPVRIEWMLTNIPNLVSFLQDGVECMTNRLIPGSVFFVLFFFTLFASSVQKICHNLSLCEISIIYLISWVTILNCWIQNHSINNVISFSVESIILVMGLCIPNIVKLLSFMVHVSCFSKEIVSVLIMTTLRKWLYSWISISIMPANSTHIHIHLFSLKGVFDSLFDSRSDLLNSEC